MKSNRWADGSRLHLLLIVHPQSKDIDKIQTTASYLNNSVGIMLTICCMVF